MSVSKGATISATDYNDLVGRISNILGTGSGDTGYGQSVSSSAVTAEVDDVTAAQMDNLRSDMAKCYTHQTGDAVTVGNIQGNSNVSTVNANAMQNGTKYRITSVGNSDFTLVGATANTVGHIFTATGPTAGTGTVTTLADIIGADASGTSLIFAGDGSFSIDSPVTNKGFNDFYDLMDDLEENKLDVDADELDDDDAIEQDTRSTAWGPPSAPTISMNFTVTFTSVNARRHFFNAGGQIWISGSVAGGNAKSQDWNSMLSNPGYVQLGAHYTRISNVGASGVLTLASSVGNYELSSGFTTIFEKEGNQTVYQENRYRIQARAQASTVLEFRITLEDNDVGDDTTPGDGYDYKVDEEVDGDLTIYIGGARSNGQIVNPFPAFLITETLE